MTSSDIKINDKLLVGTLGCQDIIEQIMAYTPTNDYLITFSSIFKVSKKINIDLYLDFERIFRERGKIVCKSKEELDFVAIHLANVQERISAEIEVKDLEELNESDVSIIGMFQTVHLNNGSFTCKNIIDLIKFGNSQLQHLKFTNCNLSGNVDYLQGDMIEISPYLHKLSFDNNNNTESNPIIKIIDNLDVDSTSIQELSFHSNLSPSDKFLISVIDFRLIKLAIWNQSLSYSDVNSLSVPCLCVDDDIREPLPYSISVLDLKCVTKKVSNSSSIKSNVNTILIRNCNFKDPIGIEEFMKELVSNHPKCTELIISETMTKLIDGFQDVPTTGVSYLMKKVIVKYSKRTQSAKHRLLHYVLQFLFPDALIHFEEIENETNQYECNYFGTLSPCEQSETLSENFETLYNRIQKCQKRYDSTNFEIQQHLFTAKKHFCSLVITKHESNQKIIEDNLDFLEVFHKAKLEIVRTLGKGIENYFQLYGNDQLYSEANEKYKVISKLLEIDYLNEAAFSREYIELESKYRQMINKLKEQGLPTGVLNSKSNDEDDEENTENTFLVCKAKEEEQFSQYNKVF